MAGHAPDYCMLVVGANAGAQGMMKEHLGLALALRLPVFVLVTKIDMAPKSVLDQSLMQLKRILRSPGCSKRPLVVHSSDDVLTAVQGMGSGRGAVAPVFLVSSVSGRGLDHLRQLLNYLPSRVSTGLEHIGDNAENLHGDEQAVFQIDDIYPSVAGVGTVVSGTCLRGRILLSDQLFIGPFKDGSFQPAGPVRGKRTTRQ